MNLNLPGTHLSLDELEALGDLNLLRNLEVFDIYQGEPVAPGKKSVTLGLTFQRFSDTLTDNQVDSMMTQILDSLRKKFDAQLRE
jgi:phenylalanyl-tRNA synthetase beta chain